MLVCWYCCCCLASIYLPSLKTKSLYEPNNKKIGITQKSGVKWFQSQVLQKYRMRLHLYVNRENEKERESESGNVSFDKIKHVCRRPRHLCCCFFFPFRLYTESMWQHSIFVSRFLFWMGLEQLKALYTQYSSHTKRNRNKREIAWTEPS